MSLYPGSNNDNTEKLKDSNQQTLFPARVKDIIINDSNNKEGWVGLGTIQFKPLYKYVDSNNSKFYAKPLFASINNYPIKEELVIIFNLPSYKLNTDYNSSEYYYIPIPINIWNNINHNSLPDTSIYDSNPQELNNGDTFKEKIIKQLLPEEGDLLFQGRFGNSIRFSSTTKDKKRNINSWSSQGINGDPIILISNKHNEPEDTNPWTPTQEDINKDGSSIWICSGQEIPINYSCKNLKSFNITISNGFNGALQIPDNNIFK